MFTRFSPISMAEGRFAKVAKVLLAFALINLVFCAGGYVGELTAKPLVTFEPKIQTKIVDWVVHVPVEKVVEKEIYIPVEKTVVEHIETYKPLRHFQNLDELERWLGNMWVLDIRFDVVDKETGQRIKRFDCEDYAIRLQEKALRDGYIISFEVIRSVEYNALFKQKRIPSGAIHAINSVILGNEVYYIEPQTHEIVFVATLDWGG